MPYAAIVAKPLRRLCSGIGFDHVNCYHDDLLLARLTNFCRKTRSPRVRPFPYGRGSDAKSRSINEVIRAPTVREGLLRLNTAVSRQKLTIQPRISKGTCPSAEWLVSQHFSVALCPGGNARLYSQWLR